MKKVCLNCKFFNNENHVKDARTSNAGICLKWSQIEFVDATCKEHVIKLEPLKTPLLEIEVNEPIYVVPKSQNYQLSLF